MIRAGISIGSSLQGVMVLSVSPSAAIKGNSKREKLIFERDGVCEAALDAVRISGKEDQGGSASEVLVALEKNGKLPTLQSSLQRLAPSTAVRVFQGTKDNVVPLDAVQAAFAEDTIRVVRDGTHNLVFDIDVISDVLRGSTTERTASS